MTSRPFYKSMRVVPKPPTKASRGAEKALPKRLRRKKLLLKKHFPRKHFPRKHLLSKKPNARDDYQLLPLGSISTVCLIFIETLKINLRKHTISNTLSSESFRMKDLRSIYKAKIAS